MSIQTPFFKSFPEQWLAGDIYFEEYCLKGLFADIIHLYWANNCEMTYTKLLKRTKDKELLDELIKNKLIKKNGDIIKINFLDEQKKQFVKRSKINAANGSKGGKAKANATNSPSIKKREEKKRKEPYMSTNFIK